MRLGWLAALVVAVVVWLFAAGHVGRVTRSLQVLDELRRPGGDSWLRRATPAPVRSGLTLEADGRRFAADLYRPGERASAVPIVLVPGLVEGGKDDPRIPPFAELLARAGFPVLVPDLPSFRTLRVHPENLADLAAAFDAVTARPDLAPRGRAGLFGVSYAGGIAVLAALDPARARRVSFVATVGAYADLDTALRFLATGRTFHRGRMRMVRRDPYGQLVFVKTFEEFLESGESGRDRELLSAMVARRTRDPSAAIADLADGLSPEGRLIHDLFEVAKPDEVPGLLERLPPGLRERMARLSPGRHGFEALSARLYLAHDRNDGTFPMSESHRLAELARPRVPVRLVVLDAVRHVVPEPWHRDWRGFLLRDLPEAARLTAWWHALLGERKRQP